jgi:hypothetical protein
MSKRTARRVPRPAAADPWPRLMTDASLLWAEVGTVMILRAWRLSAGGPAAAREAERMFGEKVAAGAELAGALAGGRVRTPQAAARKALTVYGKHVRANRKRLG